MSFNDKWDRDFDRSFAKMEKRAGRIAGLAVGAWVVYALVSLAILAGIVYVAIHFLSKVW